MKRNAPPRHKADRPRRRILIAIVAALAACITPARGVLAIGKKANPRSRLSLKEAAFYRPRVDK